MIDSKVELIDVLLAEEERLAEEDVVALDLDRAEPAGLQPGVAALEDSVLEGPGGLDSQVAEVHRVPEDDAVGDPLVDIPLVVVGQAQADHLDVGPAGL